MRQSANVPTTQRGKKRERGKKIVQTHSGAYRDSCMPPPKCEACACMSSSSASTLARASVSLGTGRERELSARETAARTRPNHLETRCARTAASRYTRDSAAACMVTGGLIGCVLNHRKPRSRLHRKASLSSRLPMSSCWKRALHLRDNSATEQSAWRLVLSLRREDSPNGLAGGLGTSVLLICGAEENRCGLRKSLTGCGLLHFASGRLGKYEYYSNFVPRCPLSLLTAESPKLPADDPPAGAVRWQDGGGCVAPRARSVHRGRLLPPGSGNGGAG